MQGAGNGMMFPLRIAFVAVVAVLKYLFGADWQVALVFLNFCVTLFSLFYLLRFIESLALSEIAKISPFLLIFFAVDLRSWARYPISDSLYVSMHCIFFTFLFRRIKHENLLKPLHLIVATFLLVFIILSRPTSLVYPIVLGTLAVFFLLQKASLSQLRQYFVPLLAASGLILLFTFSYFVANLDLPSIKEKNLALFVIVEDMRKGIVIHDRAETWLKSPSSTMDYFYLIIYKIVMFFNPILTAFTLKHKLINGLFFLSSYILTLVGVFGSRVLTTFNRSVIFFAVSFSLVTAVYHAVTIIDYDWRYRFPIVPILLLSSTIGLDIVVKKAGFLLNTTLNRRFDSDPQPKEYLL